MWSKTLCLGLFPLDRCCTDMTAGIKVIERVKMTKSENDVLLHTLQRGESIPC